MTLNNKKCFLFLFLWVPILVKKIRSNSNRVPHIPVVLYVTCVYSTGTRGTPSAVQDYRLLVHRVSFFLFFLFCYDPVLVHVMYVYIHIPTVYTVGCTGKK